MYVSPEESGEVVIDGTHMGNDPDTVTYTSTTTVEIEAIPVDGYWFDGWYDDDDELLDTDNPTTVRVNCELVRTALFTEATYVSLDADEAKEMIDEGDSNLVIIDVREAYEYCGSGGHIPGALNYPWRSGVLEETYTELDPDNDILVVCRSGNRSKLASSFLAGKGYRNSYEIGGMTDWEWETLTCDNEPPVADAGDDQSVEPGDTVTLDGSASTGLTDLTYSWEQTSGTSVTLSSDDSAVTTFTAPEDITSSETLTFELTVTTENAIQDTDTVIVSVITTDLPPEADAGEDQSVTEATAVALDASSSSDSDGEISGYSWSQVSGTSVELLNAETATASFLAPPVSSDATLELTFEVTVTDETGLQASDTVIITVTDNGITGFDDSVYTLETSTSRNMGVSAVGGSLTALGYTDTSELDLSLAPDDLLYGLIDASLVLTDESATQATFKFYLDEAAPDNYTWYKYQDDGTWVKIPEIETDGDDGISFNEDRTVVSLTITDNGTYDQDSETGVIRDPSGLAIDPDYTAPDDSDDDDSDASDDDDSGGGGGGGCFLNTLANW